MRKRKIQASGKAFGLDKFVRNLLIEHGMEYLKEKDLYGDDILPFEMKDFNDVFSDYSPLEVAIEVAKGQGFDDDNFNPGAEYFVLDYLGRLTSIEDDYTLAIYLYRILDMKLFYKYLQEKGILKDWPDLS